MTATDEHAHRWTTASEHATSEGPVIYQTCVCGRWRVLRRHEFTTVLTSTPDPRPEPAAGPVMLPKSGPCSCCRRSAGRVRGA